MGKAISVSDLRKIYAGVFGRSNNEALKGISFEIEEGESFGFVGPNGAGKSTLIKILMGALRPSSGSANLFGIDVSDPAARKGMGFVPENPSLPDFLTPLEILLMGMNLHGVSTGADRSYCMSWLERLELAAVANSPLRSFSKGMMQRTALAHAVAIRPRLLVLDEPLSGLDPIGRKDVVDILEEHKSDGGTLFFSSHVLFDVERIADRFGLIHDGHLLTIRSPSDVVAGQSDHYLIRYRQAGVSPGQQLSVSADLLSREIDRLLAEGCLLQEVKPQRSLESVFFSTITGQQKPLR